MLCQFTLRQFLFITRENCVDKLFNLAHNVYKYVYKIFNNILIRGFSIKVTVLGFGNGAHAVAFTL